MRHSLELNLPEEIGPKVGEDGTPPRLLLICLDSSGWNHCVLFGDSIGSGCRGAKKRVLAGRSDKAIGNIFPAILGNTTHSNAVVVE